MLLDHNKTDYDFAILNQYVDKRTTPRILLSYFKRIVLPLQIGFKWHVLVADLEKQTITGPEGYLKLFE